MGTKLYVANLSYGATRADLEALFAPHGTVVASQLMTDRVTGRSRGWGLVEMGSDEQARAAVAALNGHTVSGRPLRVEVAKLKEGRGGRR
jgi:RNA recognition motif-containing protein